MRYGFTILFVESVPDTLAFYERAFGFEIGRVNPERSYGELRSGDTRLSFASHDFARSFARVDFVASHADAPAPPVQLGFTSTDVATDFDRAVKAGAVPLAAPQVMPWGQEVAYLRDGNGFLIEICAPVA